MLYEAPPQNADEVENDRLAFPFGGVIHRLGGKVLGLRPVALDGDRHDEDRVGLDHLSLTVPGLADLEAAARHRDSLGIPHGDIKKIGSGSILEFRDPDNIPLELFAAT